MDERQRDDAAPEDPGLTVREAAVLLGLPEAKIRRMLHKGLLVGRREGQARQVFDNLQAALQAVGAGFEQVVKLTYYLVDASQLPIVREVRDQYINTQQPPASTAVEVRRLVRDDLLIEVEAVAVIASFQPMTATAPASARRLERVVGS